MIYYINKILKKSKKKTQRNEQKRDYTYPFRWKWRCWQCQAQSQGERFRRHLFNKMTMQTQRNEAVLRKAKKRNEITPFSVEMLVRREIFLWPSLFNKSRLTLKWQNTLYARGTVMETIISSEPLRIKFHSHGAQKMTLVTRSTGFMMNFN